MLLSRAALRVALGIVAASLAATLAWAVLTLVVRPLDGVEGDVLFEADRLRAGLALYVSPAQAAHDYGPVPARYLVLYPPLWSALLSLVPATAAATFARVAAMAAWGGVLVRIARRAPAERSLRVWAAVAAVAGTWVLALYAASGRPDAMAVAVCGLALERTCWRADHPKEPGPAASVDFVAGALFALAAWLKPNVIGAAPGAFLGAVLAARAAGASPRAIVRQVAPGLAGVLAVSALAGGVLTLATGRAWVEHLVASTGQPPSLSLWCEQALSRAPFFAAPLGLAIVVGARARGRPGAAIALGALVTSTVWCVLCFSKIGSASNYLLEPCLAAVVVIAHSDVPPLGARLRLPFAIATVVQAAWSGVASIRSAVEHISLARAESAALAGARDTCAARPDDVVLADEPGLERMLNRRIVATPFQSTHLARAGRFPVDAWIDDVTRPEVTCLVMQDNLLERPDSDVRIEHDRFGPALRRTLRARFVLAAARGGYRIYRLRNPDDPHDRTP